ncbi:hypothetical protein V1503_19295 [Bacillus sp. SCS-151]|uniref:hypothetical protein n=1 Tax=Nanhaiella sioensis TaxID=3115293 RepID=UPI00397B5B7F
MDKSFDDNLANGGATFYLRDESSASFELMNDVFEMMRGRGWFIQSDQRISKDYPSLAANHFEGEKEELKFKAEKYRIGFKIEFYQEVNTINKNGGYYDFDKLKLMPYLIRCRFLVELNKVKEFVASKGYMDTCEPFKEKAYDVIMRRIKSCWHYKEGKELPEYDLPMYNAEDKDGKRIRNGELKYFRDRKGRLQKGVVYHNINNMWWTIISEYEYTNLGSFALFDIDTKENRSRKLVKPSGLHNPKSRNTPDPKLIEAWKKEARKASKETRIIKANNLLSYLYSIDWMSRKFQYKLKPSGRIGLLEAESNAWGIHKIFDEPVDLPLYAEVLSMSSTESSWVKGLRDYVVHGKPEITNWFCKDSNGEGSTSHKWVEVREKLWEMGAMIG